MTGVYLDIDAQYLGMTNSEVRKITVYGSVNAPRQAPRVIDCRTCQNAGMGACTLYPGQCASGSAYVAAPVLRFWRQS